MDRYEVAPQRPRAASATLGESGRPAATIRAAGERRRRHLLLDLPILWRLALGFLLAAVIAAAAAGISGIQRAASLSKESAFFQSLLASNTSLTTADSFLQLMNTEVHGLVTDASANLSSETINSDQAALQGLTTRYETILQQFAAQSLVTQHADQVSFLQEAGKGTQVTQQRTLTASTQRTWQVYRDAQTQLAQDVASGDLASAEAFLRAQVEPTNADAQSALRALIQFNGRIATSVSQAAFVEQQMQVVVSQIAAALAFICVGVVGWLISGTLVQRLRDLRRVTQAVEQGELEQRVEVVGRDEVADVTASVNGMLDTIVGLLEVTRRQNDAMVNAAERLFSDVRVAGAGDLRVNASVSSDPIGMLANAFNFTVGRFRRFVLRSQTSMEQLEVMVRQQADRAEALLNSAQAGARSESSFPMRLRFGPPADVSQPGTAMPIFLQTDRARELVRQLAREGAGSHARVALDYAEQAYLSAGRLGQLAVAGNMALAQRNVAAIDDILRRQTDEVRHLGELLTRIGSSAQSIQRNATAGLAELDAALQDLANSSRAQASTPQGANGMMVNSARQEEMLRLTSAYAQDAIVLARQVLGITQEMRVNAAPFRLNPQPEESVLYTPGTTDDYGPYYQQFGEYGAPSGPSQAGSPSRVSAPAPGRVSALNCDPRAYGPER